MAKFAIDVDLKLFSPAFLAKAERVFLRPSERYLWKKIVAGAEVRLPAGGTRCMSAVGQNTFRGFRRIDKRRHGAKKTFTDYFGGRRKALVNALSAVHSRDDMDRLGDRICSDVRRKLRNFRTAQLRSYNKVRKPVDLYLEHLVAMASELDSHRPRLVPFLALPLDSQILAQHGLFTDGELKEHGLSRRSTFREIATRQAYSSLQRLLVRKAEAVSRAARRPFRVIYFDLLWNRRHRSRGGNLFETNP